MKFLNVLIGISAVSVSITAGALSEPEDDPFYFPDVSTYESAAPGTILTYRQLDPPAALKCVSALYQISYRTTNTNGTAAASVTTLIVPVNADNTKLASYQVAEDSAFINCNPSYDIAENGGDSTVQALVDAGYYVNVPDYEGPGSAFGAGILAGQSTLDSIRAALASGSISGISPDAKAAMTGYSGGSIATGWAAQLQPTYASDLPIVGASVGGFVTNLTAVLEYIDGTIAAGFLPTSVAGLATQYPDFSALLQEEIKPEYRSAIEYVTTHCMVDDLLHFLFTDIFTMVKSGRAFMYDPVVQKMLKQNTMGASPPQVPLYVHQGQVDEIVPVAIVDKTVQSYCQQGASVEYWVNPPAEHVSQEDQGVPYALKWLEARLAGEPVEKECKSSTTTMPTIALATGTCASTILTSSAASSTIPVTTVFSSTASSAVSSGASSSASSIPSSANVNSTVSSGASSPASSIPSSADVNSTVVVHSTSAAVSVSQTPTVISRNKLATVIVTDKVEVPCSTSQVAAVESKPPPASPVVVTQQVTTEVEVPCTTSQAGVKSVPPPALVVVTQEVTTEVTDCPESSTNVPSPATAKSTPPAPKPVQSNPPVVNGPPVGPPASSSSIGVVSGSSKISVSLSVVLSCVFGVAFLSK